MPSKSTKQHNFMAAIANNPAFAKKVGVPQSVGKDFNEADKGRKFSKGGDTMATKMNTPSTAMAAARRRTAMGGSSAIAPRMPASSAIYNAATGMKKGGMAAFEKSGKDVEKKGMKEGSKADMALDKKQMAMKKGGMAKMAGGGMTAMGKVKTNPGNINGIAERGKTKGKMITMKRGGKTC